jgi:hypothetical protein
MLLWVYIGAPGAQLARCTPPCAGEAILEKVERRELHSLMAAFGPWWDESDLAELAEEIAKNASNPQFAPQSIYENPGQRSLCGDLTRSIGFDRARSS